MPRSPILNREAFYDYLPDGTLHMLPWCIVNTVIGSMVEPRAFQGGYDPNSITARDVYDMHNFNKLSNFDEDQFYQTFNTGGGLYPLSYAV